MKPTLEEFRALVKEDMVRFDVFSEMSDEELETYLDTEDAREELEDQYEACVRQFNRGEITENVFRKGGVYAASSTLELMYDA